MGQQGRIPALANRIRENHADFVGIVETKKSEFSVGLLRSLTGNTKFDWCSLRARGTDGGILVGANSDIFTVTVGDILDFSVSVMLTNKSSGFAFKLVVIYGSPYEDGKLVFLDELHKIMGSWQGPIILGADFNLVRYSHEKSNGIINFKWADSFNDWIGKWGLIELELKNRKYTWTNN